MPNFPKVTEVAIPFFVAAILFEIIMIYFVKRQGEYELKDTFSSLMMGVGNVISGVLFGFVAFGFMLWVYQYRFFTIEFSFLAAVICFILDDLRYYCYHRIAHRVRFVWAEHINHHSSQHYNLSTALRQSWTGVFTGMFILRTPLLLLGFHPALIVFVYGLNLVYQFWIHTEAIDKMPRWFEYIFNTPSHHRVHHATNPRYLDANYAGTLIIWDRMFGTFIPEISDDRPRYGIIRNLVTFNPFKIAFHEWIAMFHDVLKPNLTLMQRLHYLIKPPGWSHDNSRKTSKDLKADYIIAYPENKGTVGFEK